MTSPLFSIVIPTKNRPKLVPLTVDSVLRQSFAGLEVIVVDNSDDDSTAASLADVRDARLRIVPTGGLSMPDNWEAAVSAATGKYLCLLEDKQVVKRHSLAYLNSIVSEWEPESVRWQTDALVDYGTVKRLRHGRHPVSEPAMVPSAEVLRSFVDSSYSVSKRLLPLGHFTAIRHDLIERIRQSPLGRVCSPMAPDYTIAFAQLALSDGVLVLPDPLVAFSTVAVSNGNNFRRKAGGEKALAKELGRKKAELHDLVPIKAMTVANGIYNDFMHMKQTLGGNLADIELNLPVYFRECFESFGHSLLLGTDVTEEMAEWQRALSEQPDPIRKQALELVGISDTEQAPAALRARYRQPGIGKRGKEIVSGLWRRYVTKHPDYQFGTIDDFLDWDAAQHASLADRNDP